MKTVKLEKIVIPDIPSIDPEYESRAVPIGMPKLNFMAVMYGAMGQGKTVALLRFLKMYDKTKSFDRVVWFSPTLGREPKGRAFIESKKNFELNHYDRFTDAVFGEEVDKMKCNIEEYRDYLRRLKLWDKWMRNDHNIDKLTYDEIWELDELGWEKPKTTFVNGFPSFALVLDDCVFEKGVFSANCKNATAQFFISHRHYSCCVFITSQVHANGVPRQIRGVIGLWVLFRCRSRELQEAIAKELSFKVSSDILLKVWDFATKDSPHDFLLINYKENDLNEMFRVCFDKKIILDDNDIMVGKAIVKHGK